jgi:hypothetical protein
VDEILRYDSPVQINGRFLFEPLLDDDPPCQRGFILRGLAELPVRVKAC